MKYSQHCILQRVSYWFLENLYHLFVGYGSQSSPLSRDWGVPPTPNRDVTPNRIEVDQDVPISSQPEEPPATLPPAQPLVAPVMNPALQAAIAHLLSDIRIVTQAPALATKIPAPQDHFMPPTPEVQPPPPYVPPLLVAPKGVISLQEWKILGHFKCYCPRYFLEPLERMPWSV